MSPQVQRVVAHLECFWLVQKCVAGGWVQPSKEHSEDSSFFSSVFFLHKNKNVTNGYLGSSLGHVTEAGREHRA